MPNRTQRLIIQNIHQQRLIGLVAILFALLHRGFLAFRDAEGIWLGTGSHPSDVRALRSVPGLEVVQIAGHPTRLARVAVRSGFARRAVATRIVSLGEHHVGEDLGGFTGCGPARFVADDWATYTKMRWGALLPVCPTTRPDAELVRGALDTGIALLTKTFSLARVATGLSCDGHGVREASVCFHFPWDGAWARAVFDLLGAPHPSVAWSWTDEEVVIRPRDGFDDASVLIMLEDIQVRACRLLDQPTIDAIGRARLRILDHFGTHEPTPAAFGSVARRLLREELRSR
jgi:hypothetical protein